MSILGMSFVTISVLAVLVVQSLSLTYGLIHFAPNVLDWNIALIWYFFFINRVKGFYNANSGHNSFDLHAK